MAEIPRLVDSKELDFRFIDKALKRDVMPELVTYDADVDLLTVLFAPAQVETVVHFDDMSDVAALFDPVSMNVVGFHIEAFRTAYLPKLAKPELAEKLKKMFDCLAESGELITLYQGQKRPQAQTFVALSREVHDALTDRGLHLHPVPA